MKGLTERNALHREHNNKKRKSESSALSEQVGEGKDKERCIEIKDGKRKRETLYCGEV